MFDAKATTVLTVPERADFFRGVVGEDADFILDYSRVFPLERFLSNLALSGGELVVIDELMFPADGSFADSIKVFLDEPTFSKGRLRLIVDCQGRKAGDPFLYFLTTYCGIYDVIYDASGMESVFMLASMLERQNTRLDVLELMQADDQALGLRTRSASSPRFLKPQLVGTMMGQGSTPYFDVTVRIPYVVS